MPWHPFWLLQLAKRYVISWENYFRIAECLNNMKINTSWLKLPCRESQLSLCNLGSWPSHDSSLRFFSFINLDETFARPCSGHSWKYQGNAHMRSALQYTKHFKWSADHMYSLPRYCCDGNYIIKCSILYSWYWLIQMKNISFTTYPRHDKYMSLYIKKEGKAD